jgi:hypothetical protein
MSSAPDFVPLHFACGDHRGIASTILAEKPFFAFRDHTLMQPANARRCFGIVRSVMPMWKTRLQRRQAGEISLKCEFIFLLQPKCCSLLSADGRG